MALDQFILWVNAETPYKTAKEYIAAVKERSGGDNRMKMGGTGSAQEDQIITIQLEQALGREVHLRTVQRWRRGLRQSRRQAYRLDGQQPALSA